MSTRITSTKLQEIAKSVFPKLAWRGEDLDQPKQEGSRTVEACAWAEPTFMEGAYISCSAGTDKMGDVSWAYFEMTSDGPEGEPLTLATASADTPEAALKLLRVNIQVTMRELNDCLSEE